MESLKIYYDEVGQTLTIWFSDPNQEFIAEETDEEIILMKNQSGQVIGIERLHFSLTPTHLQAALAYAAALARDRIIPLPESSLAANLYQI